MIFFAQVVFSLERSMPVCVRRMCVMCMYACVCVRLCSRDYNLSELPIEPEFQVCAFELKRTNNVKKNPTFNDGCFTQRRSRRESA